MLAVDKLESALRDNSTLYDRSLSLGNILTPHVKFLDLDGAMGHEEVDK